MQRLFNSNSSYEFRNGALGLNTRKMNLWTPPSLGAELKMWLDAKHYASLTFNGSTISQWDDRSGTGNHVSNATPASQPLYQATGFNNQPALYFDNTDDFLGKSSVIGVPNTSDLFYAAVFRINAGAGQWRWIVGHRSSANTATNGSIGIQRGGADTQIGTHNTDVSDTRIKVDVTSLTADRLATMGRSGGTVGNGGTVTLTATGASGNYLTSATQSWTSSSGSFLQIGGRQQSATGWCDSVISEVIVCSRNLTTEEREKVEGYLAHKWSITGGLPAAHPYKTTPPLL
jgi:hypothetical protein